MSLAFRSGLLTLLATLLLFATFVQTLGEGSIATSPLEALELLWATDSSQAGFVVRELRLPRALVAVLVGASLSMAGLIIQTVLRNPLGDPGLIGVSSGAAFAVAATLVFVAADTALLMPSGIVGGIFAAATTLLLARRSGFSAMHLTLAGMAVSIFFMAAVSALMVINRTAIQTLYFWLIGGFLNRTWVEASFLWYWVFAGLILGTLLGRRLDILQFEDAVSRSLGANVVLWRFGFLLIAIVLTAASVAAAGPLGFVGFAVPHLTRWLLGKHGASVGHGLLIPLVALNGAALTLAADALTRSDLWAKQMPAGILTTLFGGSLLLVYLRHLRRGAE